LHRVTKGGATARDDADFVDGIRALAVGSHQSVAGFVVSDAALFFFAEAAALAFGSGNDLFDGIFEIFLADHPAVTASGEKGGFVDGVGQVCT